MKNQLVQPEDLQAPHGSSRRIFIVAGEVSGDMQAAHLVRELRRRDPGLDVRGVGGAHMVAAGVSLLLDSSTWGVIGYIDPLLHVRAYLKRLRQVVDEIRSMRPDVLLLVDFPGFNLQLAKRLRSPVPIVYYFPPMVSTRRGNRARRVAALRMRLLAVFRPEEEVYRKVGADVRFIGHPAVDLARPRWDPEMARREFAIPADVPVVGLLPGSRVQEIRTHLPILLKSATLLRRWLPDLWFVLPVPADWLRSLIDAAVIPAGLPLRVVSEIYDAMAIAQVLVTATGSATLEAAVLGIPMVAVYRVPWLNAVIIKRMLKTRHIALPNFLAGRAVVPELLQSRMTPEAIASEVRQLLQDQDRRNQMRIELLALAADLGGPGAIGRAADEVCGALTHAPA